MTTCLCGMPNGTLHSHFCPVGRVVSRLEYAPEGTSRKLLEAEAKIQRVRNEVNGDNPIPKASDDFDNVAAYCAGYVDALRRVRRALDGDA